MSFSAKALGVLRQCKKGKNTQVAKPMRINTLNHASTWPAKNTPIKLNEKAHNNVTEIR